ncbi:MAG: hypothetical protein KGH59_03240 [Candidatus Micrarchaeota archaeon]|nr:hypothetical protein [Candidatus Micrarchaeota archaeon]MDE1804771.1 hypothetical protein [Candidatus Micrarchaeota archaeon]MDE1847018.1 hypothetical protein [Candidatus Micrarchaeota archaeon]
MKEAVEKYGTTKTLSRIINEKLKGTRAKRETDIVKKTAGMWKMKESGAEYVSRLRSESEKRTKRALHE